MRRFAFVIPALGIVILDQLSKHWCMTHLKTNATVPFLDHWLFLTLTYNPRGAFSLFPMPNGAFIVVIVLLIVVLTAYVLKGSGPVQKTVKTVPGTIFEQEHTGKKLYLVQFFSKQWIVGLIVGGGIGNLIDSIQLGAVVDFLDLRFWPVFNVADSAVSVGMILLILGFMRRSAE